METHIHIHHHHHGGHGGTPAAAPITNQLAQIGRRLDDLEKQEKKMALDMTAFNAAMDKIATDVGNVATEVKTLQDELAAALASGDQGLIDAATAKLGVIAGALEAIPPAVTAAAAAVTPDPEQGQAQPAS